MRIGCLQVASRLGDVDYNVRLAESVLEKGNVKDLDILVLPELVFSGYNFKSLHEISPFLEPTATGTTSDWASHIARKHGCVVLAGYPEEADISHKWPASPEYYNSVVIFNQKGDYWGNYRKSHLYYTDETWALEGGDGFYGSQIPGLGKAALGICMDINPYKFQTPWDTFEFATHVLKISANLVILSMAWLTHEPESTFCQEPKEPDMETLTYWIKRLEPLIRSENSDEIIVIFANRSGVEGQAVYAGTSAVVGIQQGEVTVYGILGRGESKLLEVDTKVPGFAKLVYRPEGEEIQFDTQEQNGAPDPVLKEKVLERMEPEIMLSRPEGDTTQSQLQDDSPVSHLAAPGLPHDTSHRIVGGHVLLAPEAFSPFSSAFPDAPYEESPVSPRYFWNPPGHLNHPEASRLPSTGTYGNFETWRSNVVQYTPPDFSLKSVSEVRRSRRTEREAESEFADLVSTMAKSSITKPTPLDRPSSTKLRTTSRTGAAEHSRSNSVQRSTPVLDKRRPVATEDLRSSSRLSRQVSRDIGRSQTQTPRTEQRTQTPLERQATSSPDLEKIGADLLVFEEATANRAKRDSLVCHVDEDDYIILKSERKELKTERKKTVRETDHPTQPPSRNAASRQDSVDRVITRTKSRNFEPTSSPYRSPSRNAQRPDSRSASRSNQRVDAQTPPTRLSKKVSRSRLESSGPAVLREERQIRTGEASPYSRYRSPEPIEEQEIDKLTRSFGRHRGDSRSTLTGRTMSASSSKIAFSPNSVGFNPLPYSPPATDVGTIETGAAVPDALPPTPKAMKFSESEIGLRSASPPTFVDHGASSHIFSNVATEATPERPSSVVW